MKLRRIIVIILCAVMLIAALTGCSKDTEEDAAPPPMDETTPPPEPETSPPESADDEPSANGIDYDAAFLAFPPDTVMIKAGDYTVKWAELFFNIHSNIDSILQSFGEISDWSEVVYNGMTYAELALNYAGDNALMYKALEYGAKLVGATLSADVVDSMKKDYDDTVEQYGSEEDFLQMIWDTDGISSRELFDYLVSTSYLAKAVFAELYGESGELVSDEDAAVFTANDGYLMAKHILRLRPEEGEDTALTEIEKVMDLLDNYEGDDFEAYFDELMQEYTDDGDGLAMFPNGYLFQYGDMVQAFYDACIALDIGAYSGIVETEYGYHIIYRLPINYDEIPSANYRQYDFTTLRNTVAMGMFDSAMYGWMNSLNPEYTDEYRSIDIVEIFGIGA